MLNKIAHEITLPPGMVPRDAGKAIADAVEALLIAADLEGTTDHTFETRFRVELWQRNTVIAETVDGADITIEDFGSVADAES